MKRKSKGKYFRLWLPHDLVAKLKAAAPKGPKRYSLNVTEIIIGALRERVK